MGTANNFDVLGRNLFLILACTPYDVKHWDRWLYLSTCMYLFPITLLFLSYCCYLGSVVNQTAAFPVRSSNIPAQNQAHFLRIGLFCIKNYIFSFSCITLSKCLILQVTFIRQRSPERIYLKLIKKRGYSFRCIHVF